MTECFIFNGLVSCEVIMLAELPKLALQETALLDNEINIQHCYQKAY